MSTHKSFGIGIAGLGTVGAGVVEIIQTHAAKLSEKTGHFFDIKAVSARDKTRDRGVDLSAYDWVDSPLNLAQRNDIDVVVELMGGADGVAYELVKAALAQKKHVITANKALLAHHGTELATLAEENGVSLMYEAAVAGGIPAIKALREGYAANKVGSVYGILNGTCNYILTQMRRTGKDFDEILKEAQEKGYAESDPAFDIDGMDAGHKICLLAAMAFGTLPAFESIPVFGIRNIRITDIHMANQWGYRIKLLGMARKTEGGETRVQVAPCLLPMDHPLASVEGVYNAVFVETDYAGQGLLTGRGAGAGPTASAVLSDLVDLALNNRRFVFGRPVQKLEKTKPANLSDVSYRFYLRFNVLDQPGVLADISAILRDHNISIESLVQPVHAPDKPVPIVMMVHEARYGDVTAACTQIAALSASTENPCFMRIY